jgi:hypothetical protein
MSVLHPKTTAGALDDDSDAAALDKMRNLSIEHPVRTQGAYARPHRPVHTQGAYARPVPTQGAYARPVPTQGAYARPQRPVPTQGAYARPQRPVPTQGAYARPVPTQRPASTQGIYNRPEPTHGNYEEMVEETDGLEEDQAMEPEAPAGFGCPCAMCAVRNQ